MTHASDAWLAWGYEVFRSGKATLTIDRSSAAMNEPRAVTANTAPGRDGAAIPAGVVPLTVAIDPSLIAVRELAIAVDTAEPELGRTRIAGPGTVRVAASVDSVRALEDFRRTVGLPVA